MKNKTNLFYIILIIIASYIGIFLLNNLRNIINVFANNDKGLVFISIPMVITLFIFLFYIFFVKKKNMYLNVITITILAFYSACNGVLYSSNINTFFILYVILLIYSFTLYKKINNFSFSLILGFSFIIISTMIFGMFGLLKIIKYLLPLVALLCLIYVTRNKSQYKNCVENFFNKELLIFTILFVIAIVGGIGRYVHTYDEYSHWAYDAKAVITYDQFSTSSEIMSKSRSYPPIITSWHYVVAQYSGYSEQNLYIGLSIFISIFLMAIIGIKKNSKYCYLSILAGYCCCFLFGGVYSFNSLYADLALGCVFGATMIGFYAYKDDKNMNLILGPLFIILTLIKPSGCVAAFCVVLLMFLETLFKEKSKLISKIKHFIIKYWKLILIVILTFLLWNGYVYICNKLFTDFYTTDIRPLGLYNDLKYKMDLNYIWNFIYIGVTSFNDILCYGLINLTYYQFLLLVIVLTIILIKLSNKKVIKDVAIYSITYFIFFGLTLLSIFVSLCYYEASIFASFGRYINCIHIAIMMLILYFCNNLCLKNNRTITVVCCFVFFVLVFNCPFNNTFYFVADLEERAQTHSISDERIIKFSYVNNNTPDNAKVYIIDQNDTDGIMAMWYARFYLFPRKVNASSVAITWKIKTSKNVDDLQDWGMTTNIFIDDMIKNDFDYLFFYSKDDEVIHNLANYFVDYSDDINLYKVIYIGNQFKLKAVK